MAIASMQKAMIVAHRSQAVELLARLQDAGIVQVLDAERAMVSKEWPELVVEAKRPRDLEDTIDRLGRAIDFLKPYAGREQTSLFAPRIEVGAADYGQITSQRDSLTVMEQAEQVRSGLEKLASEAQGLQSQIDKLLPWKDLSTPVEGLGGFSTSTVFVGLIPEQHVGDAMAKLAEFGAAAQQAGLANRMAACVVVCLNESAPDTHKLLRSFDFETASFEGLSGTVKSNIARIHTRLRAIKNEQANLEKQATHLAKDRLKLQVLFDHSQNLHGRIAAQSSAPATDHAIFLEGWVKKKDYPALEKLVAKFNACDVAPIEPGMDEEPPVEIDNPTYVRPFETVTRLYGMPIPSSIDPTVFLAPFFAIFFGLCMADVGYGLILVAILAWVLKKAKGDKRIFWMLLVCGIMTVLAGAITGSWFSNSVTALLPEGSGLRMGLDWIRVKMMLFDPMTEPMTFFLLSLGLGYFQIQCGLLIAFFANLAKKDLAAALCDQLTWIVHLNCLLCMGLAVGGVLPAGLAKPCGIVAGITSLTILLFTARSGSWGGRLGLGFYQLFSTVFYMGDVLSYSRLMALGMVGSGFGMAINELAKLFAEAPYVGWLLGAVVFVGGHLFNVALSVLGAFVHTMRLQFVEFFPKFFTGGGQDFRPLRNNYRYIDLKQ
ncbi:MAG: V-type ATP synthase subunit I [Planctomycetales bacterium]|nr:V-type ATP synthase subunit I [Planctomycetales bacterium]